MSIKDKIKSAKPTQFFDDEVVDGWSEWLEEHDKQIKEDAIEKFADWLPQNFDLRFSNNPSVWIDEYFNNTREKILEQLKSQDSIE